MRAPFSSRHVGERSEAGTRTGAAGGTATDALKAVRQDALLLDPEFLRARGSQISPNAKRQAAFGSTTTFQCGLAQQWSPGAGSC